MNHAYVGDAVRTPLGRDHGAPATRKVLERAGLALSQIDVIELTRRSPHPGWRCCASASGGRYALCDVLRVGRGIAIVRERV